MSVPFNDPGRIYRRLREPIDAAVASVLAGGWYVGGPVVEKFERDFAAFSGLQQVAGVANGTDAIALALRALGVGAGDRVIVPAISAYPTTVGVYQAGATPLFVDVDQGGLIDVDAVAAVSEPGVKAVVCVHLFGHMADVVRLRALADQRGWAFIEDCAQAHGAACDGRPAGTFGDAAAWSFYPTKNLGAFGDAGAVSTESGAELGDKLRRLRNYGQRNRYEHVERGFNSRLDPLQAAILSVRLGHLAEETRRRALIAARYDAALAGLPHLRIVGPRPGTVSSHHLYALLIDRDEGASGRDAFQAALKAGGVETLVHYPIPMPDQAASDPAWSGGRAFPVARAFASRVVSLPFYPDLQDDEVETVTAAVRRWATAHR